MRQLVRDFVIDAAAALQISGPIVEMGARPADGQEELSNLRPLFPGCEYIGCDIQDGAGVDRIEDIHALTFTDGSVGAVLAIDTLEHVADPIRALQELHRVLRPGGVVIMTSVMLFPIHAHPWDFWRFTPEGFESLLAPFETRMVMSHGWDILPDTVFGVGVKAERPGLSPQMFHRTYEACEKWGRGLPIEIGTHRMTLRQLWAFTIRASMTTARGQLPLNRWPPRARLSGAVRRRRASQAGDR
jgi:SAM-dependent methyltransferase